MNQKVWQIFKYLICCKNIRFYHSHIVFLIWTYSDTCSYQNHTRSECDKYSNICFIFPTNIQSHHICIFHVNIFVYLLIAFIWYEYIFRHSFVSKSIQMSHSGSVHTILSNFTWNCNICGIACINKVSGLVDKELWSSAAFGEDVSLQSLEVVPPAKEPLCEPWHLQT